MHCARHKSDTKMSNSIISKCLRVWYRRQTEEEWSIILDIENKMPAFIKVRAKGSRWGRNGDFQSQNYIFHAERIMEFR